MNLIQLKYFIEIYETQSITTAANNLFVTQPTLSLALKKLETTLDTRLFYRTGNEYTLTEQGEIVYKQGKAILEQVNQLHVDLQQSKQTDVKESVRLGLNTLYAMQFMEQISSYITRHPQVELSIFQGGSYQLQKMLAEDALDVAILSLPNYYPDVLNIEPLSGAIKGYHVYVVVPASHDLADHAELTFDQLTSHRISSMSDDFVIGRMLLNRVSESDLDIDIIALHNDLQVLLHSLNQSNSITLLPIEYDRFYDFSHLKLKWIPLKDKQNFFPIGIGITNNKPISRYIADILKTINTD